MRYITMPYDSPNLDRRYAVEWCRVAPDDIRITVSFVDDSGRTWSSIAALFGMGGPLVTDIDDAVSKGVAYAIERGDFN